MSRAFLDTLTGRRPAHRPIWIMRQAGRYLPEYRELREKHDFIEVCKTPALACEVTMQPLRRFPLDAAILFSDIMIPLLSMGCGLRFDPGPILERPIRDAEGLSSLSHPAKDDIAPYVGEAIERIREALAGKTPLIGFAGAPYTLATYLAEGRGAKVFNQIRVLAHQDTATFDALLELLTEVVTDYLSMQAEAGVDAIMLFDSWVGQVDGHTFATHIGPRVKRIIDGVRAVRPVPIIYFAPHAPHLLGQSLQLGSDGLGICWRQSLADVRTVVGPDKVLQGNLDPTVLFAPLDELRRRADRMLTEAGGGPHVVNLGHGILPGTPIEAVQTLIRAVHEHPLSD